MGEGGTSDKDFYDSTQGTDSQCYTLTEPDGAVRQPQRRGRHPSPSSARGDI